MDAFVGEIRWFAFNFEIIDWMPCDGREVQVVANQALYAVIGNTYGGKTNVTFKLPSLKGLAIPGADMRSGIYPMPQGKQIGSENTTLTYGTMPNHTHQMVRPGGSKNFNQKFSGPTSTSSPGSMAISNNSTIPALDKSGAPNTSLHFEAVSMVGGGAAHDNMQPFQVLNAFICTSGVFPVRP
ncbi:tail Collar domain-containing protein [Azorhizobium oxalatiphilum]|uniref:Tail Collar domain-containing protein n=1 Tax=Azorhizobium oxalatiphilum TaxID=980631 RepID=A0A917FCY1_9HYPH|nr:tail fiber protein [Azorhizobium oxalatiphilum]GGF66168.1 tail Collar domain-containing protein [Azorhizobium oxalatiphilum]